MVEIAIGVLRTQCLDRRIPDPHMLESEIAARLRPRNASGERIQWMFDVLEGMPSGPGRKWDDFIPHSIYRSAGRRLNRSESLCRGAPSRGDASWR
jgi:hypothetical protein